MKIIKGGKPDPPDTFLKDILITQDDLDEWLKVGKITMDMFEKLSKEVAYSSN